MAEYGGTILAPVDLSDVSAGAMRYAAALASELGWRLDLIHAWNPVRYVQPGAEGLNLDGSISLVRGALREGLEEWVNAVAPTTAPVQAHLVAGPASPTIAQVAAEVGAGLIVLGTTGSAGLRHVLLGSVTERVIRLAPCPVITVSSGALGVSLRPHRVVAGVDFSEDARAAVDSATELVGHFGRARLWLVHSVGWKAGGAWAGAADEANAQTRLEEWANQLRQRSVDVETTLVDLPPDRAILAVAASAGADLITVGASGSPVRLGRVTERVLRSATCPVLTSRSRPSSADRPAPA